MDKIQKIQSLSSSFSESFIDIADLLRDLKQTDSEAFKLVWQITSIGKRRAYALAKIGEVFNEHTVPRERLVAIGWAKLEMIADRVMPKTMSMFLHLAEIHNIRDLRRVLNGGDALETAKVMLLELMPADYDDVAEMLVQFGAKQTTSGLLDKEMALIRVAKVLKSGDADGLNTK